MSSRNPSSDQPPEGKPGTAAGQTHNAPVAHLPSPDSAVPDAATPPAPGDVGDRDMADLVDPVDTSDIYFLGGEAAVPERDYGPPIASVLPRPTHTSREIRELERRLRARLSPAFPIEHRRRLPLAFLWKRYRRLAMQTRSDRVDDFGRDPVRSARVEPVIEFLYRQYFRVSATGLDNVPDVGRAIVVANHSGTLPYDAVLLAHALRHHHPARRDARPLIGDMIFHLPYLGTLLNRLGSVRACPENAERLLAADQVIIVFPEGVKGTGRLYKHRYQLQRFGRGGFIKLALKTRSPIIPVAIVGGEEATPLIHKVTRLARPAGVPYLPITPTFPALGPLGLLPLPSKWYIQVGAPIDVAGDHGPDAAADRVLVNQLAATVRGTIQGMVDDMLAARRSALFG